MIEAIKLHCADLQECHKKVLKIPILQALIFAPKLIDDYQFSKVKFKGFCLKQDGVFSS